MLNYFYLRYFNNFNTILISLSNTFFDIIVKNITFAPN